MHIRKAFMSDLDQAVKVAQSATRKMLDEGIEQWHEDYPNKEILSQDIEQGELFVAVEEMNILAMVVLNENQDKEYEAIDWLTGEESSNLVVHRLAVDASQQGKGIARKMMDFAEDFARSKQYTSIRLDTFSVNKRNQRFYEARGYSKLGSVQLPYKRKEPYYCYELIL
jgi:ribosomal protein S18 acetylase RimI-like enzyme